MTSEEIGKGTYQKFMNTHYSSTTILILIAGNFFLNECIFRDFGPYSFAAPTAPTFEWWSHCSFYIRLAMLSILCFIWCFKTINETAASAHNLKLHSWLPCVQAVFPVTMNIVFAVFILIDLSSGSYSGLRDFFQYSPTYFAQFGLQVYPIVTCFMLRDTHPTAVFISWLIALTTMLLCCIYTQSLSELFSLITYAVSSATLLLDNYRQNRALYAIVTKLEDTLKENERLAVEAQALELRAMIGNVAHDLKTPLTSFLSGVECMIEVVRGWEDMLSTGKTDLFLQAAPHNLNALSGCLRSMNSTNSFMTMTINRCLDYTKSSKGFKLVPKLETVALKAKLEIPVQLMRDTHSSIDIQIAPLGEDICSHVITDRQWLLENLLCLLSNAVKFSDQGCVEVSVGLEPNPLAAATTPAPADEDVPPQCLRFEVQDTGIGLSDEAMQGLFNPFKQAQRLAGGTGLGLFSLARRVEAMHGRFGVTRRRDGAQGSLFWFTIPYRPDQVSAKIAERGERGGGSSNNNYSAKSSSPVSRTESPLLGSPPFVSDQNHFRVMVVDDAPLVVKMASLLLTQKGHKIATKATNGEEALQKLISAYQAPIPDSAAGNADREAGQPPYDVVLMDLQMPVLDGIEAIRRLCTFESTLQTNPPSPHGASARLCEHHHLTINTAQSPAHSPHHQFVVALSANSDHETKQAALDAGADAFLAKPFTYESFMEVMRGGASKT